MNALITPNDAIEIGLIFTRVIAIFLSFPLLNTSMVSANVKVFLVVFISFYISSLVKTKINFEMFSAFEIALLIVKELFIGFSLGLLVNIFISALSYAAEIISYFMGLTVVNVFDPTFGQISVLNRFFILLFYPPIANCMKGSGIYIWRHIFTKKLSNSCHHLGSSFVCKS